MNSQLREKRQHLERLKGHRDSVALAVQTTNTEITRLKRQGRNAEQARTVLQMVAQQTQSELEYHISEIVTLALAAVFGERSYEFHARFIDRRGRTECDLVFSRDGEDLHPLSASGGGAVDVAAFALRVALWKLSQPRSRATLLLDEPFHYLSRDLHPAAGEFLQRVSRELGLQIVMVSHAAEMTEYADRVHRV